MRKILTSLVLILFSVVLFANHLGNAKPAVIAEKDKTGPPAIYIEKTDNSHRQIILKGPDYHRGFEFGRHTANILKMEEDLMVSKLDHFIGNQFVQKTFFSLLMIWFFDVDKYIDAQSLKEMQGTSHWAPKKYENLASNYTRQIALHGLHEVGQMFVDEDRVDMGCFVSIVHSSNRHWVIGRNFDFDIDGMFDREKILKWVFPEEGHAFLSVVWPGMTGAVSGVNDAGIYVSINAAGTDDFRRVGTPTTIVVKNILLKTKSLEEAIELIKNSKVFITDIFVLGDQKNNTMAIVEKSPEKMDVRYVIKSEVVANHLEGKIWKGDKTNDKRRTELTSDLRKRRGLELVHEDIFTDPVGQTVKILRDQSLPDNRITHPGNRGSIDAFIASHSLIFDMESNIFYVNLGPGTTGEYLGYDLAKSFKDQYPVVVKKIAASGLSPAEYQKWQDSMLQITAAKKNLSDNKCSEVGQTIALLNREDFTHYEKNRLEGDYALKCLKNPILAKAHWKEALEFYPPYAKQRKYLEEKIK